VKFVPVGVNFSWYYVDVDAQRNSIIDKSRIIPTGTGQNRILKVSDC
jgi:hypothetical protein